ncbi:uncharacterized protein LOC144884639 [Branchiostoma floridae x Branchiostoma japonicum]
MGGNNMSKFARTDDNIQYQNLHHDLSRQYKGHIKEGDSSFARADLDSAEKHFAAALRAVHVRDPTAQQYQREVEPLCKLGDVYSKRGQQTGDGGDFVKAAALYNAAIARSKDKDLKNGKIMVTAIKKVEKSFLKGILGIRCNVEEDTIETHKKQLKEMRDQIELEMETIDQQLDPYVHDEDDPCIKEIEAKRAQAVRYLFENIAQQRKEFISQLVEECIGLMGPPPCKYALIGLGSQATGLVTPYSDLEFAILVEEESKPCLEYFRNLTNYLHLKVVNLGETILPALGIKSLNDFYSQDPVDNWYYDSVSPRGFAFDGSMPKASKTPLGRQRTVDELPCELICTPGKMVSILQNDVTFYLKEGYHLGSILRNPCLIAGDQDLVIMYKSNTAKILQNDGGRMAQQLAMETLTENIERNTNEETITARIIDVKKGIYRFPAVAVDCLALSSGIIPTTVWETIEDMETQQVISPNNAHHLKVLTSISAELRLQTYIANGGQRENLSALASMETTAPDHRQESSQQTNDETMAFKSVFHLPNEKQLFRYYYTAVPLKKALSKWSEEKSGPYSFPELYDTSPTVQGMMYFELCKFNLAISCCNEALKKANCTNREKIKLHNILGHSWYRVCDYEIAISYHEQALQMICDDETFESTYLDIASSLMGLGTSCIDLSDYRKAIAYFDRTLQMFRNIYGQATDHPDIAQLHSNLGNAWYELGDYCKALKYVEHSLQMYRRIYGQTTEHVKIASLLNNMGAVWRKLGDEDKTISYYEQALQMQRSIYGHSTAHFDIASSLNHLGDAWGDQGDQRKAIIYIEQALQMYRSIYGHSTAHNSIASALNNLGMAWFNAGYYEKAIVYLEQVIQMCKNIYGPNKPHAGLAHTLNNMGEAWISLNDYRKGLGYHEQALQMYRSIYGQDEAHPAIAATLNNVGQTWSSLGDNRKAIGCFEEALQMFKSTYGQSTKHRRIATVLNCLGTSWLGLGDYRKAINYFEQAVEIRT